MMDTKITSVQSLLVQIDKKLKEGNYVDSVHKIKLMTTRDMILKIISERF